MLKRETTDDLRSLKKVGIVGGVLFVIMLVVALNVAHPGLAWYICGVLGIGLVVQLRGIRALAADERIRAALRQSGTRVEVRLVEVLRDGPDDDYYRGRFTWTDPASGRAIEMFGDLFAAEPGPEWRSRRFTALVDRRDPSRYLVEIG